MIATKFNSMNELYFKVISVITQLQIKNVLQSQLDTYEYFKYFVF